MFKSKGITFLALLFVLLSLSCSGPESDQPLLTAEMPLHLEEHIDDARIEGSEVSEEVFAPVEWDFSEPQPEWKAFESLPSRAVKPVQVDDALRLPLTEASRIPQFTYLAAGIYVELPDWNIEDWAYVEISARTRDPMDFIGLYHNYAEEDSVNGVRTFYSYGARTPLITDGTVQTYRLSLDWSYIVQRWEGPWTRFGIWFRSKPDEKAVTFDLLSVKVVPKEHIYADASAGVRVDKREEAHRRTLYTHTPGRIEYLVRVPQEGRLDFGFGVLREKVPITFRIVASQASEQEVTLFEETYANTEKWAQRSVDLSATAGKTVRIALEAEAERPGSVALWTAPTLTGVRATDKPNIIFYVIDGGSSDHMSVYGYNRRTTPNLERLAAEGALFENVYSNSTQTEVSTPSFMTSLHISAMRGYQNRSDVMLPKEAVTMAQHMHRAGYQTAVFTTNPSAGAGSHLERHVDVLRETGVNVGPNLQTTSLLSVQLHGDYWRWREEYPGEPYWVHFQPIDVHWPFWPSGAPAPFAGLYVSPELQQRYSEWDRQLKAAGGLAWAIAPNSVALAKTGIDPVAFYYARRGFYDESMAHQDYQLGQLVERLKTTGEWKHTLLIVAADHGTWAAGLRDPSLNKYDPMFRRLVTRVPLLVFWPGHIVGGQRFSQTVSMIDVLPTILDLVELPAPEVMQGQSMAPLLLGEEGWEPRPVILDEFYMDSTGELRGIIEVVDRRWGASLEINPHPDRPPETQRPVPLLLYDLWDDPFTLHSLHEERPDLVEKYTRFLETQFEANRTLSKLFTPSGKIALTPEQLETLRSLGYID